MAILSANDGIFTRSSDESELLSSAGYRRCYGQLSHRGNMPCDFHLSPETQASVTAKGGYYTCPRCLVSHDLMEDLPWHGVDQESYDPNEYQAGGGTRIGLSMAEQAQIGEDLVAGMKEIPGYGSIVWWHPGGSTGVSPLDGATREWGIEVKTLGYDAAHHRFVPGRPSEKASKNQAAAERGLKGILGLLVLLNYRSSKADIYAREYPLEQGIGAFRSLNGQHLLAEIPFPNPFMQPEHSAPHPAHSNFADDPFLSQT